MPSFSPNLIVLVANQRSGTHVLKETLSIGTKIGALPEVFTSDKAYEVNFFRFMDRNSIALTPDNYKHVFESYVKYLADYVKPKPYVLLDIKYNAWHHLYDYWYNIGDAPALVDLLKDKQAKIIHLIRENVFDQVCSNMIAEITGVWQGSIPLKHKYTLNRHGLLHRMDVIQKQTAMFRKFFEDYENTIEIKYEDMIEGEYLSEEVQSNISHLLGEDCDGNFPVPLQKMTPPLYAVIENRLELLQFLKSTEFGRFAERSLAVPEISDPKDVGAKTH